MGKRLSAEERMWRAVSEKDFQATVIKAAWMAGWKYYHPPDNKPNAAGWSQKIVAGFPDLVLVKPPKLMFVELKRETGETSEEQDEWLQAFRDCGIVSYVWRPSQIVEILKILRGE